MNYKLYRDSNNQLDDETAKIDLVNLAGTPRCK